VIVRILGEGQFDVPESAIDALNDLDHRLIKAVDANDPNAFADALGELLAAVRERATPHPPDALDPSDCVLPGPDSSIEEVRALLGDEGLIPG
jgi:hypothetical protein